MIFFLDIRFMHIYLLVANGLLSLTGAVLLIFGAVYAYGISQNRYTVEGMLGVVCFALSFAAIFIGACGVVCTLLRKKLTVIINAAALALSIVAHLVLLIVFAVSFGYADKPKGELSIASITKHYGNIADVESQRVTKIVDKFQIESKCCGFTGLDGENVFLQTPWYKQANSNEVASAIKQTLPDSCCASSGPGCHSPKNINEARDQGFVHKLDCRDVIHVATRSATWKIIAILILPTLLQITCGVLVALHYRFDPPAE